MKTDQQSERPDKSSCPSEARGVAPAARPRALRLGRIVRKEDEEGDYLFFHNFLIEGLKISSLFRFSYKLLACSYITLGVGWCCYNSLSQLALLQLAIRTRFVTTRYNNSLCYNSL